MLWSTSGGLVGKAAHTSSVGRYRNGCRFSACSIQDLRGCGRPLAPGGSYHFGCGLSACSKAMCIRGCGLPACSSAYVAQYSFSTTFRDIISVVCSGMIEPSLWNIEGARFLPQNRPHPVGAQSLFECKGKRQV